MVDGGYNNNNGLYFHNDDIPKQVRQDYGHVSRWYRHINNHNGNTVFFKNVVRQ